MPSNTALIDVPATSKIVLGPYTPELLRSWSRFWNEEFADRHNFFPVTEKLLQERVIEKDCTEEPFDPLGLIFAVEPRRNGAAVVGMIHCGVRSAEVCRNAYADWPGGEAGYVALFAVAKSHRYHGVGTALWRAAESYFDTIGCGRPRIDTQGFNPFYGNCDGLCAPPWGSTEGVGIAWDDLATKRFLHLQGYEPTAKAVSFELTLDTFRPFHAGAEKVLADRGLSLVWLEGRRAMLGGPVTETIASGAGPRNGSVCCVDESRVVGIVSAYEMAELRANKVAIYEFETLPEYKGLGIGKAMLWQLLALLRDRNAETCEAATVPGVSPQAVVLYEQAGFRPVARWALY